MPSGSAWSHNLRNYQYASDSDSQNSTPSSTQEKAKEVLSEDAKLLKALDLSSRHDEAVYKPNPWTIAKLNAATRAAPSGATEDKPPAEAAPKKKEPRGRIVDGLKKQASRSVPKSAQKVLKPPPFSRTPHAKPPHKPTLATQDAPTFYADESLAEPPVFCPPVALDSLPIKAAPAYAHASENLDLAISAPFHGDSGDDYAHITDPTPIASTAVYDETLMTSSGSHTYFVDPEAHEQPASCDSFSQQYCRAPFPNEASTAPASRRLQESYRDSASTNYFGMGPFSSPVRGGLHDNFMRPRLATRAVMSSPVRAPRSRRTDRRLSSPQASQIIGRATLYNTPGPDRLVKDADPFDRPMPSTSSEPLRKIVAENDPPSLFSHHAPEPQIVHIRKKRDAYQAFSSPDADWSTLQTKTKPSARNRTTASDKTTDRFRLPIASQRLNTMDQGAPKRSRASYLPPPRAPAKSADLPGDIVRSSDDSAASKTGVTRWKVTRILPSQLGPAFPKKAMHTSDRTHIPRLPRSPPRSTRQMTSPEHGRTVATISRATARLYPSPPRFSSSPGQDEHLIRFTDQQAAIAPRPGPGAGQMHAKPAFTLHPSPRPAHTNLHFATRNSLPSPPRSDSPPAIQGDSESPGGGCDGDVIRVSLDSMERRYAKTRRDVRQARHSSTQFSIRIRDS